MTEEKAEALRVFQRQVGTFHTPPGCDDGDLERSFACNADYIYESAFSKTDHIVTITAYRHPHPPQGEAFWASLTAMPQLGACIGELYRGPIQKEPLPGPDTSEA